MKKHNIVILIFLIAYQLVSGQEKAPGISLHLAALQGNIEAVNQHIRAGSDLNAKDQFGSTPLIAAITFGKSETAEALIKAGADLNISNNEFSSPLHIAAFFCRFDIVLDLLEYGADKTARNINGSSAFDIAASPVDYDLDLYDQIEKALAPLGFSLDYNYLKKTRPLIAELLRPDAENLKSVEYTPFTAEDWKISEPAEQGIDPSRVAELYYDASSLETLYSLLIIRNNHLIAEKYFNDGRIDQLSKRASVTKSFISALAGIALDNGCLGNIDQSMLGFFPEIADKITDERKEHITIRQMLQMRGGFPWEETDPAYWDALWSGSYIDKIETIPLSADPGTEFQYSNLTSNWIATIVSRACNSDLRSFGQKFLFGPLGLKLGNWNRDIDGYYIGSGDIEFTARDMARFGQLYLDNGLYKGEQLIPPEWIEKSFENYSGEINSAGIKSGRIGRYFDNIGYGYHWWNASIGGLMINYAAGHGGQFIILIKDLNMVIVTTADSFYGKEEHFKSWKHEQSIYNVVGKFIKSLMNPDTGRNE